MYDSVQKILSLPEDTRIFMCHDYPPQGRSELRSHITVREQKQENVLVKEGITRDQYIDMRTKRDKGKAVPKMLCHPYRPIYVLEHLAMLEIIK